MNHEQHEEHEEKPIVGKPTLDYESPAPRKRQGIPISFVLGVVIGIIVLIALVGWLED